MKADRSRLPATPLSVRLGEFFMLPRGRKRRHALAAHRAHRIPEVATSDGRRCAHVDQTHSNTATQVNGCGAPTERFPAIVLAPLKPVHGNTELETQILLV